MNRASPVTWCATWRVAVALTALTATTLAQTGLEAAKARYEETQRRKPFQFQTDGREKLARTGQPEALAILAADYRRPVAYPAYARYTIATLLGRNFDNAASVDQLDALRRAYAKPEHAWLWVNTLAVNVAQRGPAAAIEAAEKQRYPQLRAAALLALARSGNVKDLDVIPHVCAALPKTEGARRALVAAMSMMLYRMRRHRTNEAFQRAAKAYIGILAKANKLSRSTQLLMVRFLGKTLDSGATWVNPEPWIEVLERPVQQKTRRYTGPRTVTTPRFFGIEGEGERICYVIDLSDSMCKEIDKRLRPKGPITGKRRRRPKPGQLPDETDIPWYRIHTRFDLAREHLKISLLRLDKSKRFSVVLFGTEAETLRSANGMVRATRGTINRVLKELDSIEIGKPKPPDAPDGTLKGRTNLHAGLRLAFSLKRKGHVDDYEFVNPKSIAEGCDTIFLLSDGAPSYDEFHIVDRDYGEGKVVRDPEYGRAARRTPTLEYWGPYFRVDWITEDVRRMNAFRGVQVHCIGIGEANMKLLRSIADATFGQVFQFGKARND